MTTEQAAKIISNELERAEKKHPTWDGVRHGHSVIREEFQEFEDAIYADSLDEAFWEVAQLGAMCLRYMKNHAPASVRQFH